MKIVLHTRWVPAINRHFMDTGNSTSNFGPEFHPGLHCYAS